MCVSHAILNTNIASKWIYGAERTWFNFCSFCKILMHSFYYAYGIAYIFSFWYWFILEVRIVLKNVSRIWAMQENTFDNILYLLCLVHRNDMSFVYICQMRRWSYRILTCLRPSVRSFLKVTICRLNVARPSPTWTPIWCGCAVGIRYVIDEIFIKIHIRLDILAYQIHFEIVFQRLNLILAFKVSFYSQIIPWAGRIVKYIVNHYVFGDLWTHWWW